MAGAVIFYDGVCGLCDRLVQFVLRHDKKRSFRFAPLQSEFARGTLENHGKNPDVLDTVCVLTDDARLLSKSRAALEIARGLGFPWRLAAVLRIVPSFVLDKAYDVVARNRYRVFGKADACLLPSKEQRERFIGLS